MCISIVGDALFEYMSYFIINRMDELEYDLKSNGPNYLKSLKYSFEYIEQLVG